MRRVADLFANPWFGLGLGIATVGMSVSALVHEHQHRNWDKALKEELPDASKAS